MPHAKFPVTLSFYGIVNDHSDVFGGMSPLCVSLDCHDAEKAQRELKAVAKKHLQIYIDTLPTCTVVRFYESLQNLKELKRSAKPHSPDLSSQRPAKYWTRAISNTKFYNFAVVWSGQEEFIAFEDRPRIRYSELSEEEQLMAALPITERGNSIRSGNVILID